MKWVKEKLRLWLGIDQNEVNIKTLFYQFDILRNVIKERTEYHVDVHRYSKQGSYVILIGKYHKRDFIKCYTINDLDLQSLIDHCKHLNQYANRDKIDAHPELTAVINNEIGF